MTSLATLSRNMLLLGCVAIYGQVPALAQSDSAQSGLAQSEQKPSKPLNLSKFAKPSPVARPRPPARPESAFAGPQPDPTPTTAAVASKSATSPLNAVEPAPANQQGSDVAKFCTNIADAALDARVAWQQKELEAAEAKLRQRIAELEAKRAEYEQWLKLREDFLKKAEDSVVEIYSRMNPDAAAQQIASMADDTAAAVLAKLRVRSASAILNEMEPARGAHLADTLAGMRRADDGKTKK
jgi:flagellar motility protein MotE (MotC chaperone)